MSVQNKTRALVEAALIVAITSIFTIIGNYIPFLSLLLFFLPVPFIILGKRHGVYTEILSIITAGIIIGTLMGPLSTLALFVQFGIMAIVMGYMMKKEYSVGKIWIGGTLASLVSMLLTITMVSAIMGVDLMGQMMETIRSSINMTMSLYKGMGLKPEKLDELQKMYDTMLTMAGIILPSAVIMAAIFSSYINYTLTAFILNRLGHKTPTFKPFKYFRLPKSMMMGTGVILLLTYLSRYLQIVHYETLVVNISYLFNIIFLIQGLAIVSYFVAKHNVSKPLRVLIYFFAVMNATGQSITIMLGLADILLNIRKLPNS